MSRSFTLLTAMMLGLAAPRISEAVYLINSCSPSNATTNTNAKLQNDITCNPANGDLGVTLNSGADLDLNGKTITCLAGQNCSAAITMTSTNSVVSGPGNIAGSFSKIVNCVGKVGSRVTAVHFDGVTDDGLSDCRKVDGNVLIGETGAGRAVTITTSDSVTINDNYIEGPFSYGVLYTNSIAYGLVSHNMFNGPISRPIYVQNWNSATVANNAFMMADTQTNAPIDVGTPVDSYLYSGNICDTNSAGCAACIAAGRCVDVPGVPFSF